MYWLLWALLVIWLSLNQAEGCIYTYVIQPPSSLGCNPLGIQILLTCATDPLPQLATLNWYWTQNVSDAGVNGTLISPGDSSDAYMVTVITQAINQRGLSFVVTNSTLGYYWCEIGNVSNVSLRPTTITPVCSAGSSQLMNCTDTEIANKHIHTAMCAVINSPFSPSSILTPCAASQQISASPTTLSPPNSYSLQTSILLTIATTHTESDTSTNIVFTTSTASETRVFSHSSTSITSDLSSTSESIIINTSTSDLFSTSVIISDPLSTSETASIIISDQFSTTHTMAKDTPTITRSSTSLYHEFITPSPSSKTIPDDTNILSWVIAFGCVISVAVIIFLAASFVLLVCVTRKKRRHNEADTLADKRSRPMAVSTENLLETASVTQLNDSFSNDESPVAGNSTVVHLGLRTHQAFDNPLYNETPLGTRPLLTQKVECDTHLLREEELVNSGNTVCNNSGIQCPNQLSLDNPVYFKPDFTIKEHIDGEYYSVVRNSDRPSDNPPSLNEAENHYQEVESPYLSPVSLNEQRPLLTRACSPYLAPIPLHQMNNATKLPASNENCYDQVHVVNTSSAFPPILVSPYEVPVGEKEDAVYDVLNEKL